MENIDYALLRTIQMIKGLIEKSESAAAIYMYLQTIDSLMADLRRDYNVSK